MKKLLILVLLAVGGPTRVAGRTIVFVDQNATGPTHDGWTWCTAFTDLQDALDLAFFDVTIRVADGTYKPDRGTEDRNARFTIINNLEVEGGYAGCGAVDPNARDFEQFESILTGDLIGDDTGDLADPSRDENSRTVVMISGSTSRLDGFTVTAGNFDSAGKGGGIRMSTSATLANLRVTRNFASSEGGGLWLHNVGDGNLLNCVFENNTAGSGGAVYATSSNVTFRACRFVDNAATSGGGGVHFASGSSAAFTDSAFFLNASQNGGGAYINASGVFTFERCVFLGNDASAYGGGIYKTGGASLRVRSCLFNGNGAASDGGGIETGSTRPDILNSTFFANVAPGGGRAVSGGADLDSCILWDGGNEATNATITNSNVQGGWPGGNIFAPPMFVDADGEDDIPGNEDDDFRLLPSSPCIDTGDPNFVADPGETDLDGFERVIHGNDDNSAVVDMGAYEFPGDCIGPDFDGDGVADVCDADRDDDGVPNNLDVCAFTLPGAAVDVDGRPLGDLNRDCGTDLIDYTMMQNGWSGPAGSPD